MNLSPAGHGPLALALLLFLAGSCCQSAVTDLLSGSQCDGGTPPTLQCPSGLVLSVTYANYSRPADTQCPGPGGACIGVDLTARAKAKCNGKASCTVGAGDLAWSDPCWGVLKELRVLAYCGRCFPQQQLPAKALLHMPTDTY